MKRGNLCLQRLAPLLRRAASVLFLAEPQDSPGQICLRFLHGRGSQKRLVGIALLWGGSGLGRQIAGRPGGTAGKGRVLLHDGLVGLGVERGADISDHLARRVAGVRAEDFRIGRTRQIVQKPHGIAVQQDVDIVVIDVGKPFKARRPPNNRS